jgi:hypothetical protein
VTDGGVLAFESELVLDTAGGWEVIQEVFVRDKFQDFLLAEGWGTGDGVGVHVSKSRLGGCQQKS